MCAESWALGRGPGFVLLASNMSEGIFAMVMSAPASPVVIENQPLKRFTRAEYDELVRHSARFSGSASELVFGQLVQMSPIGERHIRSLHRLQYFLYDHLRDRAEVRGQVAVRRVDDDSEPEPDILVGERETGHETDHPSHAFLIIEVSESSLRYDRGEKALLYGFANVDEYWVLDLVAREVEVRRDRRDGTLAMRSRDSARRQRRDRARRVRRCRRARRRYLLTAEVRANVWIFAARPERSDRHGRPRGVGLPAVLEHRIG